MRSMRAGCVMKPITRISLPQRGQMRGPPVPFVARPRTSKGEAVGVGDNVDMRLYLDVGRLTTRRSREYGSRRRPRSGSWLTTSRG
jgi:hypothetical protein